ncbi:MAG: hypothetical protein ACLQI7_05225 [Streptosporangiaceae bacterium]
MLHGNCAPRWRPAGAGSRRPPAAAAMLLAAAIAATSCSSPVAHSPQARTPLAARTRLPVPATSVLTGAPSGLAAEAAGRLFAAAPVVVVASASQPAVLPGAVRRAERAQAPLLLASPGAAGQAGRCGRSAASASAR